MVPNPAKFIRFGDMHGPTPCKLKPFGDIHGPKPCKFKRFGDMHGPKPYKFTRFGDMHGPKPCKFARFGDPPPREGERVAPAGGRREGGGSEGGRKGAPTWSERAAWREGGVSLSTRLLVRSAWQCKELDLVSVYLVEHTARPLSARALH